MSTMMLPGNPRYQPKDLMEVFGYDNLVRTLIEVELAALRTLGDAGVIAKADIELLTPEIETRLNAITTSDVDAIERSITRHDIRALVHCMQAILPAPLRRWVHVPLTSYDVIDTARALQFVRTYQHVVRPKTLMVMAGIRAQAELHSGTVQIGRTHGQHALPVTVGFWLATLLNRIMYNLSQMDVYAKGIVGKISGAVGAYNAQQALGIDGRDGFRFEERLLERLGLKPAAISTQILPPEPLAYYLYACLMLSASFGQFGCDARHLMRTEIAEIAEPFEKRQVGSSTMAHKRNPLHFENLEGMWKKNRNEFGKVLDTLISEHQRDLVGSSLARDFPILIVNLVCQLDTLLREGKEDKRPFVERIIIDTDACARNLALQGDRILAEPLYLALQMYGYSGDAHELINHKAMPMVGSQAKTLLDAVGMLAESDSVLYDAWSQIPFDVITLMRSPGNYVGKARERALRICEQASAIL